MVDWKGKARFRPPLRSVACLRDSSEAPGSRAPCVPRLCGAALRLGLTRRRPSAARVAGRSRAGTAPSEAARRRAWVWGSFGPERSPVPAAGGTAGLGGGSRGPNAALQRCSWDGRRAEAAGTSRADREETVRRDRTQSRKSQTGPSETRPPIPALGSGTARPRGREGRDAFLLLCGAGERRWLCARKGRPKLQGKKNGVGKKK